MPNADELQWIELTDFSPGIHSNNLLAGGLQVTSTNLALASPTNTYRCRSLPTGGLGPLPRRQESFTLTEPPGDDATSTYRVCGLSTWGGVFADPLVDTNPDHRAEIHLALDYYEPNDNDRYLAWIRETIYNDTPATEVLLTREFLDTGDAGTARFAWFNKTRMRAADPLEPGFPVTTLHWANNPIGGSDDNRISRAFPDPADDETTGTVVIGDEDSAYTLAITHQGRVLMGRFLFFGRGNDTGIFTNENFVWTNVNLATLSTSTPAVFVPEIDQTITDAASMSANMALVIKAIGGGYVLQGDLDDVTVVRLPNLMCPDGGDVVRGANTPIGFIYSAGDAGLYVWNGGDSARAISNQLDGNSFAGGITLDGPNGQCDRWQDLFLAPQNWVMDLETEGWWRIDNTSDINIRFWSSTKYRSQAYGAVGSFTALQTAFTLWEIDDLAYSYSWQSHPLWLGRDRRIESREALIACQGAGTIALTLSNQDGATDTYTFTLEASAASRIRNYRFPVAHDAENLTVRLVATGTGGAAEAPLIHRVYIGYNAAQSHATTIPTVS